MRLYINIDHVATLREARKTSEPDPVRAASLCEAAGADGITVHLREDRRHIQDRDVIALASSLRTVLNLELASHPAIVDLGCRLAPYQVTLVPERREEITTEGGLDLARPDPLRDEAIRRLTAAGCRVSLFIDPAIGSIDRARESGAPAVELHTGRYAHTWQRTGAALEELEQASRYAASLGLAVHAGHGLTYSNVVPVARIAEVEELNIGHSVISRALFTGLEEAVREMAKLVKGSRTEGPLG